jgi:hypothetical protein
MMGILTIHLIEDKAEGSAEKRKVRNPIIRGVIVIRRNDILILRLNLSKDIITIFFREKLSSS